MYYGSHMVPLHLSAQWWRVVKGALLYPLWQRHTFNDLRLNCTRLTVYGCLMPRRDFLWKTCFGFKRSFQEQKTWCINGAVRATLKILKVPSTQSDDILWGELFDDGLAWWHTEDYTPIQIVMHRGKHSQTLSLSLTLYITYTHTHTVFMGLQTNCILQFIKAPSLDPPSNSMTKSMKKTRGVLLHKQDLNYNHSKLPHLAFK